MTNNQWIWYPNMHVNNHYIDFCHRFFINDICDSAKLYISIDSEYAAYINGVFIACNQYHDYPKSKTYDTIEISEYLQIGENRLCVIGYYQGLTTMQYISSYPALTFQITSGTVYL